MNKPVSGKVAKVPVVMQMEALECGAACLTMIMAYYGKWVPLEQVRSDCGVSRDGSNAANIMSAAEFYGLEVAGFKAEPEQLRSFGEFPCIIHWNFEHFVVLDGFKGGKAVLNDPARGVIQVPMEEFDQSFTGVCIAFEPGEHFEATGKQKSVVGFAAEKMKRNKDALIFVILTGIISAIMGLITPGFSRVFMDRLLTHQNPEWVGPFFVLLLGVSVLQIFISGLQSIYNLRLNGKMSAEGNVSYMRHVLHLPIHFFSQRMAGDIQGRKESNAGIANSLVNTFGPLALNMIMLVFYLVVMIDYSWMLTLVGLGAFALNSAVSMYISKKRVNISRVSMRDSAKLSSATVSGIGMIETIKASGAEDGFLEVWLGYQASVNARQVEFVKMNQYLGVIPQLLSTLANYAVLILGVYLVMQGEFTVGMVMAFQGYLTQFMAPAMTMVSAAQTVNEMRVQMERVDDVMQYPELDAFSPEPYDPEKEYQKLSGNIEIKDLSFGYAPLAEPLLKDFNISIKSGDSVAFVGGSGCGKSTIAKLIAGLYEPRTGSITFDGKTHREINKDVFTSSLAVVDQDIILFEDTIENNIKMWDDSIEDYEVILAAHDANIHSDIVARPDGYQYKLIEGGKDFSGGQRQRIEIARVLAQDPTIIIMDEATSALDARTEYNVVNAIRERGITSIVVAHRLSTIRSCDQIVVMSKGIIVDKGTHDELMERCETYRELVINE